MVLRNTSTFSGHGAVVRYYVSIKKYVLYCGLGPAVKPILPIDG